MTYELPTNLANRPVTVIGAGTLGRRIALMFATRGGEVRIYDLSDDQRRAASDYVEDSIESVAATVSEGVAGTVTTFDDLASAVDSAWLVIEAVPERLELKQKIFGDLDRLCSADTILASNSSSYPTSAFIEHVDHPERVLNIHFYMPPVQNAVDIMSSGHTDRGVLDCILTELPRYGVFPFEARTESTGFIFNRVWAAVKRESLAVVAEGVTTPQELDRMFEVNTGITAGPFRLMDSVGLDVVLDIENHYAAEDPHLSTAPRELLHRYVDAGHLGVKSGQGFYDDYSPAS